MNDYFNEKQLSYKKRKSLNDNIFGLPEKRKYPLNDKSHVLSAIRMFNYVDKVDEEELANNILNAMKKYNISIDSVGEKNRLKNYINVMESENSYSLESRNVITYLLYVKNHIKELYDFFKKNIFLNYEDINLLDRDNNEFNDIKQILLKFEKKVNKEITAININNDTFYNDMMVLIENKMDINVRRQLRYIINIFTDIKKLYKDINEDINKVNTIYNHIRLKKKMYSHSILTLYSYKIILNKFNSVLTPIIDNLELITKY